MNPLRLGLLLPLAAVAACQSNNDRDNAERAAAAAAQAQNAADLAAMQAATLQASQTVYQIGGGPGVTVDSVAEIQFDNPYEGITFSSLRRIGQDTWETDTGFRINKATKSADGFVLVGDNVQIVVDLALAEVKISVGSGPEYGPYDIVVAR
ncbi:MAG: hypothetical protein R3F55_14185 [Alphaproteobacteria bacterium]